MGTFPRSAPSWWFLPLWLVTCFASPARAQAPIEIVGFPHVLEPHLASVFGTTVARGVDVVLSTDTVTLAIPIRNNTNAPLTGVQLLLTGGPFVQFQPGAVAIGSLPANATTTALVGALTFGAPVGPLPVQAVLFSSAGPVQDTLWLSVWDIRVTPLDLPNGRYAVRAENPFATHFAELRAPEVLAGNVPTHFNIQAWHDSIEFTVPFPGTHWGEPSWEFGFEPIAEPHVERDGNEHCYVIKTRSGAAVAGATVTQTVGSFAGACVTDAGGRCCIQNVPVGMGHDVITPPALLEKFYNTSSTDNEKLQPPEGFNQLTTGIYPDLPPPADPTPSSPPANGQGGGGDNTRKCVVVGGCTGIAAAIGDVFVFVSLPGAGWGIGIASAIAVAASTTAGAVSCDPDMSDVTWAGEEHTAPATLTELTLREVVDVTVQMVPPPPLRTEFQITNQFEFRRETDAATYTYSGADTVTLPCQVNFTAERVSASPLRIGVRPVDAGGQPLRAADAMVQVWFADPTLQTCQAQLFLQDDGRSPDAVANDGLYTALVPGGLTAANTRIFVGVTRVGFDITGNPAAVRYAEVPVGSILDADGLVHASGLELSAPWPNPSRGARTQLAFSLPVTARASLRVVDASGRERLHPLESRPFAAGEHVVPLDARGLEPGVYFVTLRAWSGSDDHDAVTLTRRWTVLR